MLANSRVFQYNSAVRSKERIAVKKLLENTWIRFALRASLIAIVSMLALCFVLSTAYVHSSQDALAQASRSKAEQIASHLDSAIESVFSDVYAIYNDPDVFQWLYKPETDPYRDIRMTLSVGRYIKNTQYLSDIFLFNAQSRRIYSWRTGISTFEEPADGALLRMAQDALPGLVRLLPRADGEQKGLTLTYPMSMIERNYDGRMIVLVDVSKLEQTILGESSPEEQLFVLGEDGDCLLGRAPQDLRQLLDPFENSAEDGPASGWIGNRVFVSRQQVAHQPWRVYHVLRVNALSDQEGGYLRILIITLSLLILVLLLGMLLWSWRIISPYDRLATRFAASFTPAASKNKALLLKESVDSLLQNLESMRATLGRHNQTIRSGEWRRFLLTGSAQALAAVLPEGGQVCLCVARMEGYGDLRLRENYTRRVLIRHELEQIALCRLKQAGFFVDSVDMGEDHLLLVFTGSAPFSSMKASLLKFQAQAEAETGISMAISLGEPIAPEDGSLQSCYNELYVATFLHFFTGETRIYSHQDYAVYQAMLHPVQNNEALDRLIEALRSGKRKAWEGALAALIDGWQETSYPEVQFLATLTAHALTAAFSKYLEEGALREMRKMIDGASGLMEINRGFERICEQVCEGAERGHGKAAERWQDMLLEVMDFVNAHLQDPMLSPDRIAEHVGLSTNYLRKLFKEYYDTSLSDYIRMQRMERAMDLLRNTHKTVAEIIEYVGYANRSSFFQAFKRYTNQTPEQYRSESCNLL